MYLLYYGGVEVEVLTMLDPLKLCVKKRKTISTGLFRTAAWYCSHIVPGWSTTFLEANAPLLADHV